MKKTELRAEIDRLNEAAEETRRELRLMKVANDKLKAEIAQMREHWRPVPMMHEWQPRNPQCALCDESRDAPRHRVDT